MRIEAARFPEHPQPKSLTDGPGFDAHPSANPHPGTIADIDEALICLKSFLPPGPGPTGLNRALAFRRQLRANAGRRVGNAAIFRKGRAAGGHQKEAEGDC